jgi:hypothetical protein
MNNNKIYHLLFLLILLPATLLAAGPPCRPCAGVRVDHPAALTHALAGEPRLEGEARLYVVWPSELDGSAKPEGFETVRQAGGTPWMAVTFRSPSPLFENLESLNRELEDLARIARGSGERAHFQIRWLPPNGGSDPQELAFLIKRAAVAVTGARSDARFLVGPLAADTEALRTLYSEDVAAYLDGIALAPATSDEYAAAIALISESDPGKPIVLDALPWPAEAARVLPRAAEASAQGFGVALFDLENVEGTDLRPLKLLAREFQGDLSLDPYTQPKGPEKAWSFVRGEDLSLRVIAEGASDAPQMQLFFADPQLRSPAIVNLETGEDGSAFGQRRTERGLVVPVDQPGPVVLLRLERMTAAELEGIEEQVEVADTRQMPVEEIMRRLQAFEDDQDRKLDHFQADNILHLRFLLGGGAASIEASFEGDYFFRQGEGFDWVWDTLYIDGVKWKGKSLPEIPLIEPEKAAALPVEIRLDKEYQYRLRGTEIVDGRDCWVVDFEPVGELEEGQSLHQGTVWIDREIYARVQTRSLQLGLEGNVISNEETRSYSPMTVTGQPAPWSPESYFLPVRVVGQQILSLLNASVPVERETVLSHIRINGDTYESDLQAAYESDATMVRDTEQGLRYLVKNEDGEREVEEEIDTTRLFLVGGIFFDESLDFPLPIAGVNYLALDWRGTGKQVNILFGGVLLTANIAEPRLFGSKWDAGVNLFGFFVNRGDELFRDGAEIPLEEVESKTGRVAFFLGRPLGNFTKLDFTYALRFDQYDEADDTASDFVLPQDTATQTFQAELSYDRAGYRVGIEGSFNQRSDWEFWGLPGNSDFDPEQEDYIRWQVTLAKTWWLPKFTKFSLELEHLNGENLDRFSRYDFGIFGDSSVGGYPSGLVRADEATGVHLGYGFNFGEVFRVGVEGDAVWATNEATGLDNELLAGLGLSGSLTLAWQTLVNFEIGQAVAGPSDGVAARVVFLKLFGNKNKNKSKKKK